MRAAEPGGTDRDDHAAPDFPGARDVQFDMMNAPVHAIDGEADPLAQFVAAKSLGQHAACNAFADLLAVQDVARRITLADDAFALQRLVHRLDDVAARPKLAKDGFGAG